jgi:SAM-dependent methyltransferase
VETETRRIEERYRRRENLGRYNPLFRDVYMAAQERQRRIANLLVAHFGPHVQGRRVLEIGCGKGGNLLELIILGFSPRDLVGNELLPERVAGARSRLPTEVEIHEGDALTLNLPPQSFDVVYQSTVFSSILNPEFRQRLANRMWEWLRPRGAILWYDLAFNNPRNPDIRGIAVAEIRRLFPHGALSYYRVTLAPPISRLVTRIHPGLYTLANVFPFLRTHRLCWIAKR